MIAAIYARKSTDQNLPDAEKSVTRQVEHATAYAARKGWTVDPAHVYQDDGISGAEFEWRPGFLRLMNALKPRPPFQVLIMSEESRLGREQIETAYALKQVITAGVRVFYYLEDRERTLDSPTDKTLLAVSGFADEVEREKARQRTYDAMRRKAEAGHVTGGVVFGYDNVRVNGHVERQVHATEAAVVRRIFEQYARGDNARRIALALNAEGAAAPTPRRTGRPRAWSASTVGAILTRPLYKGEVLWNPSRKRDAWGRRQSQRRAPADWIRCTVPALAIVPEALWQAVAARRAATRAAYVRTTNGRLHGRPASGIESRYLLTGLATCAPCGGSLVVHSTTSGDHRKFLYRCQHAYYRGPTVCTNRHPLSMLDTNRAVLQSLEEALLTPAAVEAIVHEVLAAARPVEETAVPRRAALRADLVVVEAEIARLTSAIARAPDLGSLLDALRAKEQHRTALQAALTALDGLDRVRTLDAATLTPAIVAKLGDWSGLMGRKVGQARQILRHVLDGRITFTPQADGRVAFVGYADPGPLFAGTVLAGLGKTVVSPTGFATCCDPADPRRGVPAGRVDAVRRAKDRRESSGSPPLLGRRAGGDGGDHEEPSEAFTWSTSCPMSLRHANRSPRSAHANTSTVPSTCSVRAGAPGVAATSWRSRTIHVWSGCSESVSRMFSVSGTRVASWVRVASSTIRICCIASPPHSSSAGIRGARLSDDSPPD